MKIDFENKEVFWHTSAHVLAQAVKKLFPDAKLAIGPTIENGFYYDFHTEHTFTPEDLKKIEKEMRRIIKKGYDITYKDLSIKDAKKLFENNKFKIELINELAEAGEKKVRVYYHEDDFYDLCRGPHLETTRNITAYKLLKVSSAYWRGDSNRESLQRIYGITFPSKEQMKEYINFLREAEKRDHRKIGKKLDLFSFHEEAPGSPFFHDKGNYIFRQLVNYMTELLDERGYELNRTPLIMNESLWKQSGHYDHYKENMYFTEIDGQEFAVKPMNCPGNLLVFKANSHSYRELPIKAGEFGIVHRHELRGVLSGLFRVRFFTQDDAHVFCTEEQIEEQVKELIDLIGITYKTFGFSYNLELSTRPEKAIGSDDMWNKAESALKNVLEKNKIDYKLNLGDGAFYGPKIDFHVKDAIGRSWQCGTIQLDFSMPEKFDLKYKGKDGEDHRPVMIHRAIYGSLERFMGILVEHYAGKFPLWMNPNQIVVLPITDRHIDYCNEIYCEIKKNCFRVDVDDRRVSLPKKIREAQLSQYNYILVIGDDETTKGVINIRTRNNEVHGEKQLNEFIKEIVKERDEKK